jgi:hypothetical protein
MRCVTKGVAVALAAGLTASLTLSAYANGSSPDSKPRAERRAHAKAVAPAHRPIHVRVRAKMAPATVYPHAYRYVPDYAYYVPTRVFRCYPARQMVEDQVGLVVGYVPLGTCG